ncbi:thiamine pyrophosphate-dependent enzyme [Ornithinimicrobium sufpigmenti]|uniref:thiamine pyrophosphate-dependent enzyme n=1 Tax=Ornithinimicrobium sufpigmenti TaxID=2508882 RepID=UPI001036BFA8|nr:MULTISPECIES: thiamine pyrophosphate-dependent enzyme [unclassified Ornithinimicrobium]
MSRHGGHILVQALLEQGVEVVTCVPGESFLPVLDGLHDVSDRIRLVVAKHEGGAGSMAEAYGKLTQRAGVCLVTRGPGAMHAAVAVHTAQQDATPLVLMIGQVSSRTRGRGSFQEHDAASVFGSMAKAVLRLETADRIPEIVARAFRVAESGRRGPVVVELPEDVLHAQVELEVWPRLPPLEAGPSTADLAAISDVLRKAERPLIVVGRGPWSEDARLGLETFALRNGIPVLAAFRCQDYIGTDSPAYCGHLSFTLDPTLQALTSEADLVLAIGGQLGDVDTQGYGLWSDPRSRPRLLHAVTDPVDANRHLPAEHLILASGPALVRALEGARLTVDRHPAWLERARSEQAARSVPAVDDVLGGMMAYLAEVLPPEAVVCSGAGNYAVWVHRYMPYRRFGSQLAPASGAMGYGLPAGTMASLLDRDRPVVVFGGDGCLLMSVQELATVSEHGLTPVIVVVNNGIYGTIRMHQERTFPGRTSGTDVHGPDFVALARAFGLEARRVGTVAEFAEAWQSLTGRGKAVLIEVVTDPDVLAPGLRTSALRSSQGPG